MSRIRSIAVAALAALTIFIAQPKPAEAGDAGRVIAGIAIGAVAAGLLSHSYHNSYHSYAQPYPSYGYAYAHPYPPAYAYAPAYAYPPAYAYQPVYPVRPAYAYHGGWNGCRGAWNCGRRW